MLTQGRLKELLGYDPETGLFTWLKATSNRIKVGYSAGCINRIGYVCIRIDGGLYLAHRLAWLYMTGEWPVEEIDHKDLNKSNNCWRNLREATRRQNNSNKAAYSNNTSGHKGVSWYPQEKKWRAQIRLNGGVRTIGRFADIHEAAAAYSKAANDLHGEFARVA